MPDSIRQREGHERRKYLSPQQGTTAWTKLSFDTNSPYDDHSATTGTAYGYMAIGVISDVEIGLPGDVVVLRSL